MEWARLKSSSLVWLLLGAVVPLLFLLDWAVQSSGSREVWLEAEFRVGLDGQDPLLLATALEGDVDEGRLEVRGAGLLREGRYPWRPTSYEAELTLRLERDFLEDPGHFTASYRLRRVSRPDGLSTPPIPCKGEISVRDLRLARDSEDLTGVEAAELDVELICTSSGNDLLWNTGDERVWMVSGPLSLKVGGRLREGATTP